jgi:nucleoside-diphosphate-sugar epimerase
MVKLIFGCGYLGLRVARRWLAAGHMVYAVTRSQSRADELAARGLSPWVGDVTRPETLRGLPEAETVLYAVGYDRRQGQSMHEVYVAGLNNVLGALPGSTGRVIYVSSTGVYGDSAGEWVDEHTPCRPQREGGRACLAAEQALAAHPLGARGVVLRLAGIYGPGRIPRKELLLAGEPIPSPAEGYLNLIHVDDAAAVVLAAERAPTPRVYVVSDGHPPRRRDYYMELARLAEAPPPRFSAPPSDAPAAQRAGADKRACNARLLRELDVRLAYPTFREGLAAIWRDEDSGSGG